MSKLENNEQYFINPIITSWKVMVIDDEIEVHNLTQLALEDFKFQGKPITFLSAYSSEEAKSLLQVHSDIALIFLDVVMEEKDSGLKLVKYIRDTLQNKLVRIILRTGQPNDAPEESVIINYDINDYKLKLEMMPNKLFVTTVAGLRCYRDLITLEFNKTAIKQMNEQLQLEIAERQRKEEELAALNRAYERFVPEEFLNLLDKPSITQVQLGDQVEKEMTVLFSDIRGFTSLSERMTPQENFNFLNSYLSKMVPIIYEHHGVIDKYIGDAIMALFPKADDAVRASIGMLERLIKYNQGREMAGYKPISIGIGLNTGSLMLGTVGGKNRMDGTVISDAVNLASCIEGMTKRYGVALLISQYTYENLDDASHYATRIINRVRAKGKSEAVTVYEVFDGENPHIIEMKMRTCSDFQLGLAHYRKKQFVQAEKYFKQMLCLYPEDRVAQIYLTRCEHFQQGCTPDWDWIEVLESK